MYSLVYKALDLVLRFIEIMIFIRVIVSWIPVPRDNRLIILLYQITEPILAPIRSMIQRSAMGKNMMFDFSPIVAFLLLALVRYIVLGLLF
mgnify:CR=1 FL=1